MKHLLHNLYKLLIITILIISSFISCNNNISQADSLDLTSTPIQRVNNMFAIQSNNGVLEMRIEADIMEHYDYEDYSSDYFPKGVSVYSYTKDGLLESIIVADEAKHLMPKKKDTEETETWSAFGNVILHNVIKQETMETDTVYWDQSKKEIYTDCYVKLYSPDGFTQGIGMRSDDHVRNSILYNPFDSYAVMERDTSIVVIDSVNFIGAFPKK